MIAKKLFRILKLKPLTYSLYVFLRYFVKISPGQMAGRNSILFMLYIFTKISKNCNGYGNIRINNLIQHIHFENIPTDFFSVKVHLSQHITFVL